MSYRWLLLTSFLPLAGCFLVLGDGDGDDEVSNDLPADDGWSVPDSGPNDPCEGFPRPDRYLRDPHTGQCRNFGGGGPPGCETAPRAPLPLMAECETGCEILAETDCLVAPGCRAAYTGLLAETFVACWGVSGQGGAEGPCAEVYDAYACSGREDCSAWHEGDGVIGNYRACLDERTPLGCEGLDEPACVEQGCEPLYQGEGCACTPAGCVCESWTYESCREAAP